MNVFISYAKTDIAVDEETRIRRLAVISELVSEALGPVFVDEIHNHGGDHSAVEDALESATAFCLVRGPAYDVRGWTQWEYGRASERKIPMFEFDSWRSTLRRLAA
jgi:hypothetical protein